MLKLIRTDSKNKDFIELVKQLDNDLAKRDGDDHTFYAQFNKIDHINHVIICYDNDRPVGCGAIKPFNKKSMEIKRMYTVSDSRGKGIATKILLALEKWALELNCESCILETGTKQPEAIMLYKKNGFVLIPNYGQYAGIENSVCFEKKIM